VKSARVVTAAKPIYFMYIIKYYKRVSETKRKRHPPRKTREEADRPQPVKNKSRAPAIAKEPTHAIAERNAGPVAIHAKAPPRRKRSAKEHEATHLPKGSGPNVHYGYCATNGGATNRSQTTNNRDFAVFNFKTRGCAKKKRRNPFPIITRSIPNRSFPLLLWHLDLGTSTAD